MVGVLLSKINVILDGERYSPQRISFRIKRRQGTGFFGDGCLVS